VRFVPVLTGYVPLDAESLRPVPMRARPISIGYRGWNLGYWYGDLGREKVLIGKWMKEACERRGLAADIAWEEAERFYGDDWFGFLGRCKATLGTESGSNVFDFDGTLRRRVEAELRANPGATYEEVHAKHLAAHEGKIVQNQISPKVFEAIACRTALILFEGRYSGVLEPQRHYIPLKKDFSNVDEVLGQVQDDDYLEALTSRAHRDIVQSGRYSYRGFVERFDDVLEECWAGEPRAGQPWLPLPPADALLSFRKGYQRNFQPSAWQRAWRWLPEGFRTRLRGLVGRERIEHLRGLLRRGH
jgi:hypothetical protein